MLERRHRMKVYSREFYRRHGSAGGKIGGRRRALALTPKERQDIARKAGIASALARRNGK